MKNFGNYWFILLFIIFTHNTVAGIKFSRLRPVVHPAMSWTAAIGVHSARQKARPQHLTRVTEIHHTTESGEVELAGGTTTPHRLLERSETKNKLP